jgi:hypothetical protein
MKYIWEYEIRYLDLVLFVSEYKEIIIVYIIKPAYTRQNDTNTEKTNTIKTELWILEIHIFLLGFFLIVIIKVIQHLLLQLHCISRNNEFDK